ncbi:hypothetical protein [Tahibacter amnicola]|uniref:Transporter n=1 Tax=Tahibacter amnicola TaxID=2976241 RepID=A0ABY6BL42_9GAMM|nr:hypothetical protein [Tahibacter amnicola]UXI70502.1 hypothetical protein N4264_12950 [Tahibacter amnicola]
MPLFRKTFSVKTLATAALGALSVLTAPAALSQGCVIARGGGAIAQTTDGSWLAAGHWQVGMAYRWFRSDRHFVGHSEQTHRQREGSEVVNRSHFLDLNLTYAATDRLWITATIPYFASDRSSLYEHDRVHRHHTQSAGLADVRVTGTWWMRDPESAKDMNWAIGVGIKAPTGDYENTDVFQRTNGPTTRYVDSSIQPGDGGWGVVVETQGYWRFAEQWAGYFNGSYLINPAERNRTTNFSVPDAYLARIGVDFMPKELHGFGFSLGGRVEGVPPHDLIGGNGGSRRPGYAISVEPGVQFANESWSAGLTVPVAVDRSRQRTYRAANHGDAAFADYSVNFTINRRF